MALDGICWKTEVNRIRGSVPQNSTQIVGTRYMSVFLKPSTGVYKSHCCLLSFVNSCRWIRKPKYTECQQSVLNFVERCLVFYFNQSYRIALIFNIFSAYSNFYLRSTPELCEFWKYIRIVLLWWVDESFTDVVPDISLLSVALRARSYSWQSPQQKRSVSCHRFGDDHLTW